MKENEAKQFYLFVKGKKVEVSEEIYRAYVRPISAEQKRRYRAYSKFSVRSLEDMQENGMDVEAKDSDIESRIVEDEEHQEELDLLRAALEKLEGRDKEIINMFYFEKKSQTEIGAILGVAQQQVSRYLKYALAELKKHFKKIFKEFLRKVL